MKVGQDHSDRVGKIKFEAGELCTDFARSPEVCDLDRAEPVEAVEQPLFQGLYYIERGTISGLSLHEVIELGQNQG